MVQHSDEATEKNRQAAFERLWSGERERVYRLLVRLTGLPDAAEDLTQEVFLRAYPGFGAFRNEAKPSTWLHRIAINATLRWRENQRAEPNISEEVPDQRHGPETQVILITERDRVTQAIERLPDELRIPLILHAWEGRRYREIAKMLEIPLGTVMSRLHSARKRLREELSDAL